VKYELIHGLQVPKIGFGTWSIGGRSSPDRSADAKSLAALRSALTLGYRHFDTAEMYAAGHSEELLGQAIREVGVPREQLFLTSKVLAAHLRYADALKACERSLRRLGVDYLDLHLIHWPNSQIPLSETFRALNELVRDGRVRHVGVSNFDLKLLKQARQLSSTPILADQAPFSLRDRTYSQNGVLEYCQQNGVLLTAYTPFEEGGLRINGHLASIAKAHDATPHQIALAWLVAQPHVITIPMSHDPGHQRENLAAADIELSSAEMAQLN
jgi:diketogulonate reductase-like aldo/keto reductase